MTRAKNRLREGTVLEPGINRCALLSIVPREICFQSLSAAREAGSRAVTERTYLAGDVGLRVTRPSAAASPPADTFLRPCTTTAACVPSIFSSSVSFRSNQLELFTSISQQVPLRPCPTNHLRPTSNTTPNHHARIQEVGEGVYHFPRLEASLPTQMLTCTPRNYPKYVCFPRILPFSMHAVRAPDTYPRLLLDISHTHLKFPHSSLAMFPAHSAHPYIWHHRAAWNTHIWTGD